MNIASVLVKLECQLDELYALRRGNLAEAEAELFRAINGSMGLLKGSYLLAADSQAELDRYVAVAAGKETRIVPVGDTPLMMVSDDADARYAPGAWYTVIVWQNGTPAAVCHETNLQAWKVSVESGKPDMELVASL